MILLVTVIITWICFYCVFLCQISVTVQIIRKKSLVVSIGDGAKFIVLLHQVWRKHPLHQDFLGFYTMDTHKLSEYTHGLLGMNSWKGLGLWIMTEVICFLKLHSDWQPLQLLSANLEIINMCSLGCKALQTCLQGTSVQITMSEHSKDHLS